MNIVPAIILIVVAAIAGYVLGMVDSRLTASLKKKDETTPAPEPAPAAEPAAPEKSRNRAGEHTVLKVTIDTTLRWHVDLDDVRCEDPTALSVEKRQRLADVAVQLRPWLDANATSNASAPVQLPNLQPRAIEPAPLRPASPTSIAALPAITVPAKIDPMRGFRSLLKNEIKSPMEKKATSIVAMIDEVLQARLLIMPQITESVRLEEGAQGEVIVFVGKTSYSGVDSVPDPEIRSVIKAAITEWEKLH
jgi:hypothetical protein